MTQLVPFTLPLTLPLTSIVTRLAVVTLFVVLPLVASTEVAGAQACIPTRSPVSDPSHVPANTLAVRDADLPQITRQTSHSNEIPDLHPAHYLALTLWGSLFFPVITACLVYLQCAQFWARVWDDRVGRVSQGRQVHRHTDYGVASAAPDDDPAPSSEAEVSDSRNGRALVLKGRQPSIATAPSFSSASHSNEPFARTASPPSIREDEDQLDDTNATSVIAPGPFSSTRTLTGTIQAPSLCSEPLADPPSTSEETCLVHADSAAKRACSMPEPSRPDPSQAPSRNPSLPHPNYERTPPHLTNGAPLKKGLFTGSKDLAALPVIQWFILFIEVGPFIGTDDEEDSEPEPPERNFLCLKEMFNIPTTDSTSIYFESLAGANATPTNIKNKLKVLYLKAGCVSDDSLVLVFLTGTGDEANRMRLLNNEVVTEANIRDWVLDVRTRSRLTNVRTVPIIFDICRENIPSAEMHRIVDLLWSCSRGQRAHAIGFAPDIPNSSFLLALFWAAYDISDLDNPDFEKTFRSRLAKLVRIRRYSHDYWLWKEGKCKECGIGNQCTPPGPQDPEGEQAGWDVIASLGALIMARYPEYVRNIVTILIAEMQQCAIWEASNYKATSLSSGSLSEALVRDTSCKEEHRGATQHVAAGSTINVVS